MKHHFLKIALASSLSLFSLNSEAMEYENFGHLNKLAKNYIEKRVMLSKDETLEVRLADQGSQLQLKKCDIAIDIDSPYEDTPERINTLEMSCNGLVSWHVYVPIEMRIMTDVLVARSTIPSKEIITNEMVTKARFNKNQLYTGYFKHPSQVIGQAASKTIIGGNLLTPRNVQQPVVIKKNQLVSIIARKGAILVKAEGIAKSNGALNDTIKVLNKSSKKMIEAIVTNQSTVEVHS